MCSKKHHLFKGQQWDCRFVRVFFDIQKICDWREQHINSLHMHQALFPCHCLAREAKQVHHSNGTFCAMDVGFYCYFCHYYIFWTGTHKRLL